jgi:uncharacterized protein
MRTLVQWIPKLQITSSKESFQLHQFLPIDFQPALKTRLLILQPTPFCNIDCAYCYLPNRNSTARMSLEIVRQATQRLSDDDLVGDILTIVWHAGEPLAMPISFYEDAIPIIREVLGPTIQISHSIQTNATLINDAWCTFFKKHDIRVGVSVDGPAHLHDRHRHTRLGNPTHHLVVRGIELLKAHNLPFHAIAVVTASTLGDADTFFEFFLQHGIRDVGCNFDEAEGIHATSSLYGKEEAYAVFLAGMLRRTLTSQGGVRVRELDNAYQLIAEELPSYRWRGETWPDNAQVMPFAFITVAWNGEFSTFSPELLGQPSQDFDNFILGNVTQTGYLESAQSTRFIKMWSAIVHGTRNCRNSCPHFAYCGGGSPINKLYENGALSSTETLYCRSTYKQPLEIVLKQLERDRPDYIALQCDESNLFT